MLDAAEVARPQHGVVQFLDGRDEEVPVRIVQLGDELLRVARPVNAVLLEMIELLRRLVVQVVAVDHEDDLVHLVQIQQQLCGLEAGQSLTAARSVPHVAVPVRFPCPPLNCFGGVVLIRTQYHQDLLRLVDYRLLGDHFRDVVFLQKRVRERHQVADFYVVRRGPGKGLVEGLRPVIRVIFSINAVRNHENLHELKKALRRPRKGILVVAIDLFEGLF